MEDGHCDVNEGVRDTPVVEQERLLTGELRAVHDIPADIVAFFDEESGPEDDDGTAPALSDVLEAGVRPSSAFGQDRNNPD